MAGRRDLRDRSVRHDPAYLKAKREKFAGRAIYKLEELDRKFRLLGTGKRVLDLGCWPGSWLQYIAPRVGDEGLVVGLDLKEVDIAMPPWVHTAVADINRVDPEALIQRFDRFDVVLSDMAPHTCGDRATDQVRSEDLFRMALSFATQVLRPGGHFAAKVFQGGAFPELLKSVRSSFSECKPFHTANTRSKSPEQYIVGRGFRG